MGAWKYIYKIYLTSISDEIIEIQDEIQLM